MKLLLTHTKMRLVLSISLWAKGLTGGQCDTDSTARWNARQVYHAPWLADFLETSGGSLWDRLDGSVTWANRTLVRCTRIHMDAPSEIQDSISPVVTRRKPTPQQSYFLWLPFLLKTVQKTVIIQLRDFKSRLQKVSVYFTIQFDLPLKVAKFYKDI